MSLNRRLFAIRRLKNHLNEKSLLKLADGLFTSKIRFGLQLLAKVRLNDADPLNQDIENIQKVQNKLLRMLTNTKLLDMVSTASLLTKTNFLSVNQLNAQIKIQEIWKSLNVIDYPIQLPRQVIQISGPSTRACTNGRLIESGFSSLSQKTCINDAVKMWNSLPDSITMCETLSQVKKTGKTVCSYTTSLIHSFMLSLYFFSLLVHKIHTYIHTFSTLLPGIHLNTRLVWYSHHTSVV